MVVGFGFLRCGYGCGVWICDVAVVGLDLRFRGREKWEKVSLLGFICSVLHASGFGLFIYFLFFFLCRSWFSFYERRSEGLKS